MAHIKLIEELWEHWECCLGESSAEEQTDHRIQSQLGRRFPHEPYKPKKLPGQYRINPTIHFNTRFDTLRYREQHCLRGYVQAC